MTKYYNITAMYEYSGRVEANSPEEAEKLFLDDLNMYYYGTYSYECEVVGVCDECGRDIDESEIVESGLCYECEQSEAEDEEEEDA